VRAISPITDEEQAIEEIRTASIVTTSVWAQNLARIAPLLAKGLRARLESEAPRINVLACENAMYNSDILRREVLQLGVLSDDEIMAAAAFPNTVVDRLVMEATRDGEKLIDVTGYFELVIEKNKLVDAAEQPIEGAVYAEDLLGYLERKLYCVNCGHAWAGFVGNVAGFTMIKDVFTDPVLVAQVREAMMESAVLLAKRHGFTLEELEAYVDSAIKRFQAPGIADTVARVSRSPIRKLGPDERLVGPAVQCEELGLDNTRLLQGIAAAFLYDDPEDEQSVELQAYIRENGIEDAVTHYTGIQPGTRMHGVIVDMVRTKLETYVTRGAG
jgi:mannitol-1-phosphate 5-dehydrogenase